MQRCVRLDDQEWRGAKRGWQEGGREEGGRKGRGGETMVWRSLKEHKALRSCVWPWAVEEFGLRRKELSLLKGLARVHCPPLRAEVQF